ncbi:hypothetical protein Tco_0088929 [Tanacetum coccineum]
MAVLENRYRGRFDLKERIEFESVFPCRHINRSVFVVRVQRPINPGPPFPLVPKSTFFNPLINFGGFMDCQHGNPMWVCGVIDGEVFGCTWEVKRGESDRGGVYGDLAGNAEEDKQCFECDRDASNGFSFGIYSPVSARCYELDVVQENYKENDEDFGQEAVILIIRIVHVNLCRVAKMFTLTVKGLAPEEFAARNYFVQALPDRNQAIPDGGAAAPKLSGGGWAASASRTNNINFDSGD